MHKQTHKVIDSVSASELLKALNTLKNMNCPQAEFQISFSKENIIRSDDFPQSTNTVNYEDYIVTKHTPKKNKQTFTNIRVSPSPLKEVRCNIPTRTSNFKSRSHSPIDKRSERTNSRISNTSKYQMKQQPLKSVKKQQPQKKDLPCPSMESKRILSQKQKTGYNYVPIQHRAEELLRQKQQKIARLQKQQQFSKILQEKQCTFKPQIKPYTKKKTLNDQQQIDYKISQAQRQRFEQCFIDQQFLCTPTQPFNQQSQSLFQQSLYCKPEYEGKDFKPCARKYKNEKFNCLLDLIQ